MERNGRQIEMVVGGERETNSWGESDARGCCGRESEITRHA